MTFVEFKTLTGNDIVMLKNEKYVGVWRLTYITDNHHRKDFIAHVISEYPKCYGDFNFTLRFGDLENMKKISSNDYPELFL